jgi:hypothetical protein
LIWFHYSFILAIFCSNEGFKLLPSITPPLPPASHNNNCGITHVHGYQRCALSCSDATIVEYREERNDGKGKKSDVPQEWGSLDLEWLDDAHAAYHDAYYKRGSSKQLSDSKTA